MLIHIGYFIKINLALVSIIFSNHTEIKGYFLGVMLVSAC